MSLHFNEATCRFTLTRSRTRTALERFSLHAAPFEATCLVGPNGARKSTALAAAAGLMPLASGSITYRDRRVDLTTAITGAGYLPQHSRFPKALRVAEVLDFAFDIRATPETGRREIRALTGLDDKLDHPVGTLSTGWMRRLGLAVALPPPLDLLMLDEPFVGLDHEFLDALVTHLAARAKDGTTLLVASHDFDVVDALRARVAVLREGRLVSESSGAPREGSRKFYRRSLAGVVETRKQEKKADALSA